MYSKTILFNEYLHLKYLESVAKYTKPALVFSAAIITVKRVETQHICSGSIASKRAS